MTCSCICNDCIAPDEDPKGDQLFQLSENGFYFDGVKALTFHPELKAADRTRVEKILLGIYRNHGPAEGIW